MIKKYKYFVFLVLLTFIFVSFFYGKLLITPNSYFIDGKGDALKNYYTYAYFIKNNQSNIEFEGMNYPYQENFMYTDCHPLQASILKQIHQFFPSIANYSVGILNLFMLASFLITAIFLYLIFVYLKINKTLAVLSAVAITILSPQVFRFGGHWALSYSFSIPMILYLLLIIENKYTLKRIIMLIFALLFLFFTHAYLGIITALIILAYTGISFLIKIINKDKKLAFKYLKIGLTAIVSIVIFYAFVKLTDNHSNRTTNPWGIYIQHSSISSVFLPTKGPLNELKNQYLNVKPEDQVWEGRAYVGLVAIISMVIFIIASFKKNSFIYNKNQTSIIQRLFIVSVLFFLFAALLPNKSIWEYIFEKVNLIKQFRAIGRFAWVIYYVGNILAIFVIDRLIFKLQNNHKKITPTILIFVTPLIIAFEGIPYHQSYSVKTTKYPNWLDINQTKSTFKTDCESIGENKYQAIIALPYFYIGSDNYGKEAPDEAYRLAFLFSYHLKLPMFNSYLTRTSLCESKNIMQLLSSDFYKKSIKNDIKSDLPFLIMFYKDNLTSNEKNLLSKANLLVDRDDYMLYEIDKKVLFKETNKAKYNEFLSQKDSLYKKDGFLVSDTNLIFKYVNFNDKDTLPFENNRGVFKGPQNTYNTLFSINGKNLIQGETYRVRFWIYNGGENCGQDMFKGIAFFNQSINGESTWLNKFVVQNSLEINGNWTLVEIDLTDINPQAEYTVVIKGDEMSKKYYYIDDLLFYNKKLTIYKDLGHQLYFNNHFIDKK